MLLSFLFAVVLLHLSLIEVITLIFALISKVLKLSPRPVLAAVTIIYYFALIYHSYSQPLALAHSSANWPSLATFDRRLNMELLFNLPQIALTAWFLWSEFTQSRLTAYPYLLLAVGLLSLASISSNLVCLIY